MSAIKFFILKYGVKKDFVFNPAESLAFEGETGPYIQYTFARCASILTKYQAHNPDQNLSQACEQVLKNSDISYSWEGYSSLLFQLAKFPAIVQESAQHYKPEILTKYLFQLAQGFNSYYTKNKILTDMHDQTLVQVSLVFGVQQVLHNGLKLLGITTVDKM